MQVQLRRYAARRELAAATRRRSQELVSGAAKINRIIFWKSLTRGRRRRIVGTQRRWFESKIPQRKRPYISPELWSTTLPSDIPALADTRPGGSALRSPDPADSEGVTELDDLYEAFSKEQLAPLWTQVAELMPGQPTPSARPHVWRWKTLFGLAERAGRLVPVDRGGERRARARLSIGTPRTRSASWWKARGCGPSSTATRCRCNVATFCSRRAGISTAIRTSLTRPWHGWTALTSPSSTRPTVGSSPTAPTR